MSSLVEWRMALLAEDVSSLVEWRMAALVDEYLGVFPHVMWEGVFVSSLGEE